MDPFSSEVELIDLRDHFAAGRWQEVVDYDTSSLSPENKLPARTLALRARVTLGEAQEVLAETEGDEETPETLAVKAIAQYASGQTHAALQLAEDLAANYGDNSTVQVFAATVLQNEGKTEEALALLSQHQGNCTIMSYNNSYGAIANSLQCRQSPLSCKFTFSRTGQIWLSRRSQQPRSGHRITYSLTLRSRGSD